MHIFLDVKLRLQNKSKGKLEVYIDGNWQSISNLGFNFNQIRMACEYFGYEGGGYLNVFEDTRDESLVNFSIDCDNVTSFDDCIIKRETNFWFNRFYVANIDLVCYRDIARISIKKFI